MRRLSRKPVPDPGLPGTDVVDSIVLSETDQEFDVMLRAGYCVSPEAVKSPVPAITVQESEPLTITVSADKRFFPRGQIRFMSPDIKNRCDLVQIEYGCDSHVRIVKTFKDDGRCAWLPDHEPWSGPID